MKRQLNIPKILLLVVILSAVITWYIRKKTESTQAIINDVAQPIKALTEMDTLDFIAKEEGFSAKPYWDYKQWSIGHGFRCGTNPKVKPDIVVTREQAKEQLRSVVVGQDLPRILANLRKVQTPGMLMALVSFSYNLGFGNAIKMINRLNSGEPYKSIAVTWAKYHYAGGKPNEHLKQRRAREIKLFLS